MEFSKLSTDDKRIKFDFKICDIFAEASKTRDLTRAKRQIHALKMTAMREPNKINFKHIEKLNYAEKLFD